MEYKINTKISKKQRDILKEIIDEENIDIYINNDNLPKGWTYDIIIKNENKNVIVKNKSKVEVDNDEYFQFEIEKFNKNTDNYTKIYSLPKIVNVSIFNDKVFWKSKENSWNVDCDVKIKIIDSNENELLIQPIDSLAGFIFITNNSEKELSNYEIWKMKTDELTITKEIEDIL